MPRGAGGLQPARGSIWAKPPRALLGAGTGLDLAGAGRDRCVCKDTAMGFPLSGVPIPAGRRKVKSSH